MTATKQSPRHLPSRRLPSNVAMADYFASFVSDGVTSVACDAKALNAILLNVSNSDVVFSRLLANAMADFVEGTGLEIGVDLEDGGFLLSAIQHPQPTIRCILARERLPYAQIRDDTSLRTLRWLLSRIHHQAPDVHPFIKTEVVAEAAKLPAASTRRIATAEPTPVPQMPAVKVLMQAKTREGRASLPPVLPLVCAEVCPLMDEADIILLDVASVNFRATKSWETLLRLNPMNELAKIVVVADTPCHLHIENARLVDWDTRISDFREILLEISGKAPPRRTLPPPRLTQADEVTFDGLVRGIEAQVSNRAARRADRIRRLADALPSSLEEARAAVSKAQSGNAGRPPALIAGALDDLALYEVTTERIAFQVLGWTDDHLRRWLRERSLPSFKDLITQAQVRHAVQVLTRPGVDWPTLTEELGMTQKYLKRWAREHGVFLPASIDENTHLARVTRRLRRRQS